MSQILEDRGSLQGTPPSWQYEEKLKQIKGTIPHRLQDFGWVTKFWGNFKYKDGIRYIKTNEAGFLDKEIIVDKDLEYKITSSYKIRWRGNCGTAKGEAVFWEAVEGIAYAGYGE